jgi:tetratricopeptide (TPR) repeat protein
MESEHVHLLKHYIEKMLGRRVLSSTDCRFLFNAITQQLGSTLSFNTLRRFFKLMETKHKQSVYTLNILSAYCGFSSFDDFITVVKQKPSENNGQQNTDLLFYLVMLFKETEISDENDFTFFRFVGQTITFLEYHPDLIDQFQREIAKTNNGQLYYYEQFVNFDRLNAFYGDGLRYYLHEKKTMDAQIFGNYLLCLRYWLAMDNKNLGNHYHAVIMYELNKNSSPATAARYYAVQLMQASNNPEQILVNARQYYANISLAKDNFVSVFRFYCILSHTLLLTRQYEEALFYIDEFLKNKKKYVLPPTESSLAESIHLFKAIALLRSGEKATGKEWLDSLNTCNFSFLSKQYLSILYLSTKQSLKKSRSDQKQLQYLVRTTGFVKLLQL